MDFTRERYESLRSLFKGRRLPLAFVDLDAFDSNVDYAASLAQATGKRLRIGTKSLRCLPLMERALAHPSALFHGFLTFTAEETAYLAGQGLNDFLLAYPTAQTTDLELLARLTRRGRQLSLVVDHYDHLLRLHETGKASGVVMNACMEIDMAYRPFGSRRMHLGLRRSPIRTPAQALELVRQAQSLTHVKIDSVMGYEGHIAGTNDDIPRQVLSNTILRAVKRASIREYSQRRRAIVSSMKAAGIELRLVNGGGSGSLKSTLSDDSVTEATVGSGLFAPGLFHYFKEVKYRPSAFFALQVVRRPAEGMVTCAGGGYIASGATEKSKRPLPVMPTGLKYIELEGAGEVQTPLAITADCPQMNPGDPIFFQHAKAGELCERFNDLLLIQGGKIIDSVKTYRGEGFAFL